MDLKAVQLAVAGGVSDGILFCPQGLVTIFHFPYFL